MNEDLQKANDLLLAMEQQRNNLANQLAQAALAASAREIAEAKTALATAQQRIAELEKPSLNGHAETPALT